MNFLIVHTLTVFELLILCISAADFESVRDVNFLLRIRNRPFNDEEIFQYNTREAVTGGAFDPTKPTTFLIHGFLEDRKSKHHLMLSK
jgi:hypothetical protein